jgi:uncharacterized glyoxalase superfamily metalloenzyme YdcJ
MIMDEDKRKHAEAIRARAEELFQRAISLEQQKEPDPSCDQVQTRAVDLDLDDAFTYQPPTTSQVKSYEAIRDAAKFFASVIVKNTPSCPDQTAAIRKLRECVMTANASIALRGRY